MTKFDAIKIVTQICHAVQLTMAQNDQLRAALAVLTADDDKSD
jgi:hypothetical protein